MTYIAFEGIDGCGKSTQVSLLCDALPKLYITPIRLAEPTYGKYGSEIRNHVSQRDQISVERQRELFTLDRREHVRHKIKPLLRFVRENGSFVIVQDRSYLSAPAYQAEDEDTMRTLLREQQAFAPKPDIVFLLDLPEKVAIDRLTKRRRLKDLFDEPNFLEKARQRYLFLASEGSERVEVLDGAATPEQISERVLSILNFEQLGA